MIRSPHMTRCAMYSFQALAFMETMKFPSTRTFTILIM